MPVYTAPEIWAADDGEATTFNPIPYTPHTPGGALSPTSATRPITPGIFTRRLSSASSQEPKSPTTSMFSGRGVLQNKSNDKGKAPAREDRLGNGDIDSVANHPFATYDRVRPPPTSSTTTSSDFNSRKNRSSILGAASEAFSFKFGRKPRPVLRQPPLPIILPDVIEISAPPPDQEVEERNRLREMAAQAIGISPFIVHPDSYSQEESTEDEDDDALRTPADNLDLRRFGDTRNSESTPEIRNKSFLETSSISTASHPMRYRSGSVASHSRHNSIAFTPIPAFPTNVLSLNPFLACSGYFPKYSQPSSLRRFALSSKNWKTRYIILSAPSNPPTTPISRHSAPAVSYLHVFKSSGPDDKELERLEIHTDSAVFVADEEVGGRRNVIRIKGFEAVSGKTSSGVHETTWQVHIIDPVESQKWITAIKSAILGQRTLAAGLGIPTTPTTAEPRGDLDVIMKMRSQGLPIASKAPAATSTAYDAHPPRSPTDRNYASSISSQSVRSQATTPKSMPSGPVSALKTLFTSRPRSGSRVTSLSVDSERQQGERDYGEDSFTSMGSNLLGMLRSNHTDTHTSVVTPIPQRNAVPFTPYAVPVDRLAERKVLAERGLEQWATRPSPVVSDPKNRSNRALSLGALSLQPPPRKRWTSLRPTSGNPYDELAVSPTNTEAVVTSEVFGSRPYTDKAETEPPSSPLDFSSFTMTSYDQRPRASSIKTVDTNMSEATKRSSVSAQRSPSTNKRWSRQLPPRQTPPSGPVPVIPAAASLTQLAHSINPERPPSVASSQQSVVSRLPSFSKRASTSSSHSVKSSSTKDSAASLHSARNSVHRTSMPPPQRPPPTSALPLAPDQDPAATPTPTSTKSFRNSMQRVRLSMMAPKPPPSSDLPPRPDEPEYNGTSVKKHNRQSSSSARSHHTLDSIPEPEKLHHPYMATVAAPFPPPNAPLPPPPSEIGLVTPTQHSTTPAVSRHSSLKQRLRMLSASSPSPASVTTDLPSPAFSTTLSTRPATTMTISTSTTPLGTPTLMHHSFIHSTPNTPTAEKMMSFSNAPYTQAPNDSTSFLNMNATTPTPSSFAPSRLYDHNQSNGSSSNGCRRNSQRRSQEMEEVLDEVAPLSLSPPPRNRRGSQLIATVLPVEHEVSVESTASSATIATLTPPAKKMASQPPSLLSGSSSMYEDQEQYDDRDEREDEREDEDFVNDDDYYVETGIALGGEEEEEALRGDVLDGMCPRQIVSTPPPVSRKDTSVDTAHAFSLPPHGSVVSLGHVSL